MGGDEETARTVSLILRGDQLEWADDEAHRVGKQTGGDVRISRSAIVRRLIDDARAKQQPPKGK